MYVLESRMTSQLQSLLIYRVDQLSIPCYNYLLALWSLALGTLSVEYDSLTRSSPLCQE